MRVLIADNLPAGIRSSLAEIGCDVDFQPALGPEELVAAVREANVLIVRSTKVTQSAIERARNLQFIVRAGAGTNTIDCAAAAAHGIYVSNCPGKNAVAVAELTMGLVLSLDRRIPENVSQLKEGLWNKKEFSKARGLLGQTMGIVGMGQIGQEVALRARAFGMKVMAWSRSLTDIKAEEFGVQRAATVKELCAQADVITVHLPLVEQTKHIIGCDEFAVMREDTLFVNAARGGVVDDQAMLEAVNSGRIRAASDVFEDEPKASDKTIDSPLASCSGFYGTHHIGASTEQAQDAVAQEVLRLITTFKREGTALNVVNAGNLPSPAGQLHVRHLDKIGVLAHVLEVLRRNDINVADMQNVIFDGAGGAVAKISLSSVPSQAVLAEIDSDSPHVLGLTWLGSMD
jgi:D-3-phosphoglycerate dehydrogenase